MGLNETGKVDIKTETLNDETETLRPILQDYMSADTGLGFECFFCSKL